MRRYRIKATMEEVSEQNEKMLSDFNDFWAEMEAMSSKLKNTPDVSKKWKSLFFKFQDAIIEANEYALDMEDEAM